MTDPHIAPGRAACQSRRGDFLRAVAESVVQLLMEADVDGMIGAGRHERTPDRQTYRNGFRDRALDTRLGTLHRPLRGDWPYLWLDATSLRQREGGRIGSVAAIIAVAVDGEGRHEIVGLPIGPSEAETFWSTFLKRLVKRGLLGVKPVTSDAHEGLKGAIRRVTGTNATWQRCSVHWLRNALAYGPKAQQTMAAAGLRQAP